MKLWKNAFLFYLGGTAYITLEFIWRGRSHGSMFLLGGLCFSLLGKLGSKPMPMAVKTAAGAAAVTGLELAAGFLVNRDYRVWDYRGMPLNYQGQICLPYALLWLPLSLAAIWIYGWAEQRIAALTFPEDEVK